MYLDESYDDKASFICLAGVIVRNDKWKTLNEGIDSLKMTYFKDLEYNLKMIRRRNYDPPKSSQKLSKQKITRFEKDYFSILKNNDIVLIIALIDKSKMALNDKITLFELVYSFLIERFEYFLDTLDSYGSVIMDAAKNSKEVNNLWEVHRKILKEGVIVDHLAVGTALPSKYKQNSMHKFTTDGSNFVHMEIKRIVENLQYQQDKYSNLVQVADLVASAFSVKYNRKNDKFFKKYEKFLRRGPRRIIDGYGLKIFP